MKKSTFPQYSRACLYIEATITTNLIPARTHTKTSNTRCYIIHHTYTNRHTHTHTRAHIHAHHGLSVGRKDQKETQYAEKRGAFSF